MGSTTSGLGIKDAASTEWAGLVEYHQRVIGLEDIGNCGNVSSCALTKHLQIQDYDDKVDVERKLYTFLNIILQVHAKTQVATSKTSSILKCGFGAQAFNSLEHVVGS